MKQDVILTISVMISKKKDTIIKCLDSVMPLLQSVSSELILVDTGCDQETLELVKKYTDNIVKFQWCNDFSKARNEGIKKARGKWFLYLDDDEWFEDVSELISFFNTGEYLKYGYGMYYQRNYSNDSGIMFEDAIVHRMVKLEYDIQFIYSIHECFNRMPGQLKQFKAYVHHYGYVYKTDAEKYAHTWRNIKPLLQELNKEPNNLKHVLQLAQEYNVIGEYEKSIEISLGGIAEWGNGKAIHSFCLNSLYANIMDLYKRQYRHENLYSAGKEYLNLSHLDRLTRCLIEGKMAWACYEMKSYEECIDYVKNYVTGYKKYKRSPESFISTSTTVMNFNCFDNINLSCVLSCGIQAAVKRGMVKLAQEWFPCFSWKDKILITDGEMIKNLVRAVASGADDAGTYLNMCDSMLSRNELVPIIIEIIEEIIEESREDGALDCHCFADLKCGHWYFDWLKIRRGDFAGREEKAELYCRIWKQPQEIFQYGVLYGIWQQMKKDNVDSNEILNEIPIMKWENTVSLYCSQTDSEALKFVNEQMEYIFSNEETHFKIWRIFYLKSIILGVEKQNDFSEDNLFPLLYEFKDSNLKYYSQIYTDTVFSKMPDALPVQCQISLKLNSVELEMGHKNYGVVLSKLKEIVELNFRYTQYIKLCSDWIQREIKEDDKRKNLINSEFAQLARSVKSKVRALIRDNRIDAAQEILNQLEKMIPDDDEIPLLWKQINV